MTNVRQTVSIESITIDPEFRDTLSEKVSEEYTNLKEDIRVNGIRDSLIIGIIDEKEYLVDGHHRLKIGEELELKEVPIIKKHFANRDEAKMWIVRNQLMSRNLNDFQKCEAALQFKDYFSAKAKENQRAAGGAVSETCQEPVDTYKELGKIAGISDKTVRKVEKILQRAAKKDVAALRDGKAHVSIHSVYQECTGKTSPPVKPAPKPRAKPKAKPANEPPHVPPSTEGLVEPEQVEQSQTLAEQIDDIISALGNAIREDYASTDERINFLDRLIDWASRAKDDLMPL